MATVSDAVLRRTEQVYRECGNDARRTATKLRVVRSTVERRLQMLRTRRMKKKPAAKRGRRSKGNNDLAKALEAAHEPTWWDALSPKDREQLLAARDSYRTGLVTLKQQSLHTVVLQFIPKLAATKIQLWRFFQEDPDDEVVKLVAKEHGDG